MNMHNTAASSAKGMSERRVGLLGALVVALGPISMSVITPALPELVAQFGTSEASVKLTLSIYFAGFAIAQLICGPLSDALGRKSVTLAFTLIYLVATLAALLAPTIEWLIAARFAQGVGAAVGVSVSRALVRDLFTGDRSVRIMNLISIIIAAGPALSPTLGGILTTYFGWQSVFVFMGIAATCILITVQFAMLETVTRDVSRIRPTALMRSYTALIKDRYFIACSFVTAGTLGAVHAQVSLLPFLLMDGFGMSATQFGIGLLLQSGGYLLGSLLARQLMPRFGGFRLMAPGMAILLGSIIAYIALPRLFEPGYWLIMVPTAIYAIGMAFIMPPLSTASVAAFPHMAGAAASLAGFIQLSGGFLGGVVVAWVGDPLLAQTTVIPALGLFGIAAWLVWRRMPEPALARVVLPQPVD